MTVRQCVRVASLKICLFVKSKFGALSVLTVDFSTNMGLAFLQSYLSEIACVHHLLGTHRLSLLLWTLAATRVCHVIHMALRVWSSNLAFCLMQSALAIEHFLTIMHSDYMDCLRRA